VSSSSSVAEAEGRLLIPKESLGSERAAEIGTGGVVVEREVERNRAGAGDEICEAERS
jgi:hypothetical protein